MTKAVSLEDYAAEADRRIREAADMASRDMRHISLPYMDEERSAGVDWDFIEEREGQRRLIGYVPTENGKADGKVVGNSGVTIASGFDLGQHSPAELKAMGLYQGLIDRLTPYMKPGLRKEAAQKFLERNPLRISDEEARMIDRRVQIKKYNDLASQYDATTRNAYGAPGDPFPGSAPGDPDRHCRCRVSVWQSGVPDTQFLAAGHHGTVTGCA